jgi:hypothetical protein
MLSVCMCARFQATLKECHLMTVKRIMRYLVLTPYLGLWYSKGAHFELVSYSNAVIPRSEKEGTKPPYVCPGCSNHTHSNNMINRCNVINKRVIFLT